MRKGPTIRDVAREAGVSIAVVSRVLNASGSVAPHTHSKVIEAIDVLGYQPRQAARELQSGSASTIGLVLADLTNPFFARLSDRVVWEARARGIQVVFLTTQEDPHVEADAIDTLIRRSVSAVIATPTADNPERWQRLVDLGIGVIFVDRRIGEGTLGDVVSIKNYESAQTASQHLIDLGHERIAFISGPENTSTGRDRIAGFRDAMSAAGIHVDGDLIHAVPFRGTAGSDALAMLLHLPEPPTALIVANTAQVRSVLMRLKQSTVEVPHELSLIVFDDNPWTELVTPPLTAVRQPIDLLALHSVELAVARARGTLTERGREVSISAEFVRRSSTRRLAHLNSVSTPSASLSADTARVAGTESRSQPLGTELSRTPHRK